jgi:antitoxin component YwqK of YwqJK toxin-antitoxin module
MGKEFHQNGNLYYEGNYQNNEPHGDQITLWHPNKQTMYTGGMIEGKKRGHGTEFYENGQILFNGDWHENEPYGKGIKIYNSDGSIMFEGDKDRADAENGEGDVNVVSQTTTEKVTPDGIEVTTETVTTQVMDTD